MLPAMAGEPDDNALMLRYRAGDTVAFERLYARHKGPVYRYFLRQCGDAELAGDLLQELWAKIIAARHRYEARAKFTTYMYTLAHNCWIDNRRRESRRPLVSASEDFEPEAMTVDPAATAERGAINLETAAQLEAAIAALPEDQREAFLLREEAGLSLAEIAVATDVPEETAKSRLRYAVQKLKRALLEQGAWP